MGEQLLSVGIDIGTSTTQLVVCALRLENHASQQRVPRVAIVGQDILYRSRIHRTPLLQPNRIDGPLLRKLLEEEYEKARITKGDVETGVVIITGQAARKENAKEVARHLSDLAGDFVVTTAGADKEAILAGKGAGAFAYSKEHSNKVMNLDIGGGTTNAVIFQNGEVLDTACFDIGGRVLVLDQEGRLLFATQTLLEYAKGEGIWLRIGEPLRIQEAKALACGMTTILKRAILGEPLDNKGARFITNHGFQRNHKPDAITFSGGVADCKDFSQENPYPYCDLGAILGHKVYEMLASTGIPLLEPKETIRGTVIGAGSHTTKISGSTISCDKAVLPLKNIPLLKLKKEQEEQVGKALQREITTSARWLRRELDTKILALCLRGHKGMRYEELAQFARAILEGMETKGEDHPLVVLIEQDLAKALGFLLREINPYQTLVCIDGIAVEEGDYVDIGLPKIQGMVVPVVIKTLLFGS